MPAASLVVSRPAFSHHQRILREAGVIREQANLTADADG
jgi:hypothetical protein